MAAVIINRCSTMQAVLQKMPEPKETEKKISEVKAEEIREVERYNQSSIETLKDNAARILNKPRKHIDRLEKELEEELKNFRHR